MSIKKKTSIVKLYPYSIVISDAGEVISIGQKVIKHYGGSDESAFQTIKENIDLAGGINSYLENHDEQLIELENGNFLINLKLDIVNNLEKNFNLNSQANLLNNIPESIIVLDTHGKVRICNSTFAETFGVEQDYIVGKSIEDLFQFFEINTSLAQIFVNFQHTLDGNSTDDKYEVLTRFKKRKSIHLFRSPYRDKEGRIIGVMISIKDITAKVKSDKKLADVNFLLERSPIYILKLSIRGKILIYNNKKGGELIDYFDRHGNEKAQKNWNQKLNDIYKKNEATTFEMPLMNKTFFFKVIPLLEEKCMNIYATDITEIRIAEKNLAQSKARYEQIIENANDIIYRVNFLGFFTFLNHMSENLLGISANSKKATHFMEVIHPDYKKEVEMFYNNQFEARTKYTYLEFPILTKNGNTIWIGQNVHAMYDHNSLVEFTAVARDITERKRIERELIVAKNKAEESSLAKELFLTNMSHEIRTPLNAIKGMSRLLEKTKIDKEQAGLLNTIISSSDSLIRIINDILDFSKINAGQITFEKVGFKPAEVIESVIKSCEYRVLEKDLALEKEVSDKVNQIVIGDPYRLQQVLLNIVSNATKFTEEGSINIKCNVEQEDSQSVFLKFTISDTGIGIPEDKLSDVFQSFVQAENNTTRKYGGTGLGLAICKQMIEAQNGTIDLESESGVGTTFHITIPFEKGQEQDLLQEENHQEHEELNEAIEILIVEDNPINQLVVTSILDKWNLSYQVADNGEIAIGKIADNNFDLILMDIQMPVMDGITATKHIRQELKSNIPIIALTANAMKGDEETYLEAGMNSYLSKPFEPEKLKSQIIQYTSRGK